MYWYSKWINIHRFFCDIIVKLVDKAIKFLFQNIYSVLIRLFHLLTARLHKFFKILGVLEVHRHQLVVNNHALLAL
jgi:hypothetical protein